MYYTWDLKHNYIGFLSEQELEIYTNAQIDVKRIKYALESEKQYGFYKGYYISIVENVKLMCLVELRAFYNKWLSHNYKQLQTDCPDEDLLHNTILYVYNLLERKVEVNSFRSEIKLKYFSTIKDNIRYNNKHRLVELDLQSIDLNHNVDIEYLKVNALKEINDIKLYDSIKYVITKKFSQLQFNIYIDYCYNYKDIKHKGLTACGKKYNITRSQTQYLVDNINKELDKNKNVIMDIFNQIKYPKIEDITLKNIILDKI